MKQNFIRKINSKPQEPKKRYKATNCVSTMKGAFQKLSKTSKSCYIDSQKNYILAINVGLFILTLSFEPTFFFQIFQEEAI
jgi:hypothetical protein